MTEHRRPIDTKTLDAAARFYASRFLLDDVEHPTIKGRFTAGPSFVMREMYQFTFKDEFDHIRAAIGQNMGPLNQDKFERLAKQHFEPRSEDLFANLLDERLGIRPDGSRIPRRIGKTVVGSRFVDVQRFEVETQGSIRRRKELGLPIHVPDRSDRETRWVFRRVAWNIYAGEEEERAAAAAAEQAGRSYDRVFDELPDGWEFAGLPRIRGGGYDPQISNEAALAACNAIVDLLDEGSTAAEIRGRTGTKPAGVDATETGTLLFTLPMSDPAFGNAADIAPGARATANSITDDSSADDTGTLTYCRAAATGTGADDHIDGEGGTAASDFIFNTQAVVAGALISMSAFTFTMPEG